MFPAILSVICKSLWHDVIRVCKNPLVHQILIEFNREKDMLYIENKERAHKNCLLVGSKRRFCTRIEHLVICHNFFLHI
jgi:hypothetical protein